MTEGQNERKIECQKDRMAENRMTERKNDGKTERLNEV
jgi:hypothetical protein